MDANEQKEKIIDQIERTQNSTSSYPLNADGTKNFKATPIETVLTRDEIAYLVEKYFELRNNGKSHGEACRRTYACVYRQSDTRFNPAARLNEIRSGQL